MAFSKEENITINQNRLKTFKKSYTQKLISGGGWEVIFTLPSNKDSKHWKSGKNTSIQNTRFHKISTEISEIFAQIFYYKQMIGYFNKIQKHAPSLDELQEIWKK